MFLKLKIKFKELPILFYAMSIAATWANAGSLLNGISTAQDYGIIPYMFWAVGNMLACIVFGIFAPIIPKLRDVFRSKVMGIIMGIMCPFQCWISMNGIQTVFSTTPLGSGGGIAIALVFAVIFIVLLLRFGMIRNILTDHLSWSIVYVVVFVLTIIVLIAGRGNYIRLYSGIDMIGIGIKNGILLIPGAFLYPYYYKLLDFNESNGDEVRTINIRKAFIYGGIGFGIYQIFVFLMALANFGYVTSIIKAILVTLIAVSSLSSFIYSIYLIFGRKLGIVINVLTILLWQFLIPIGVMGAWTLMASIRIYIVLGAIIISYIWYFTEYVKSSKKNL